MSSIKGEGQQSVASVSSPPSSIPSTPDEILDGDDQIERDIESGRHAAQAPSAAEPISIFSGWANFARTSGQDVGSIDAQSSNTSSKTDIEMVTDGLTVESVSATVHSA